MNNFKWLFYWFVYWPLRHRKKQQWLFLSFRATLRILNCEYSRYHGDIPENTLHGALFYFGCRREYALTATSETPEVIAECENERNSNPAERGGYISLFLISSLRKAEDEKRTLWRERYEKKSMSALSFFLEKHRYPAMPRELLGALYSPLVVERWAKYHCLPLIVWW